MVTDRPGLLLGVVTADCAPVLFADRFLLQMAPRNYPTNEFKYARGRDPVRIAVRSWSHNDPALGHSGDECPTTSCFWPTRVYWKAH